ncbi:MAG: multicopper oxidase domain-containing protein, partial [Candidatus Sulfotelmatobacter sp.]
YLLAMGNEIDLHSPHWHGETVNYEGRHTDVVELLPGSMKTVDMIADNLGSWMFHCHVDDHMEAGMIAIYTIYKPQTRKCPVTFSGTGFWGDSGKATLTVKNVSGKEISNISFNSEMFLAPQDLRQPDDSVWISNQPIGLGEQQTIEKRWIHSPGTQSVIGWVFSPIAIKFADGSTWRRQSQGECFQIFWRDPQHPDVPALPPLQFEINAD